MIYTLTLNPSIDYIVGCDNFELNRTNRTQSEEMRAGGKGINVSIVLNNLGVKNCALGIAAGFTGMKVLETLDQLQVDNRFIIQEEGNTRINVKFKDYEGTELNGAGPKISNESYCKLMEQIERIKAGDILVISGSLPCGMNAGDYENIARIVSEQGGRIIADTTKDNLKALLKYKPLLVKPNIDELEQFFTTRLVNMEHIEIYARKLQELGAENVIVSLGGEGAMMIDSSGLMMKLGVPSGEVVNTVGAGDSMIAGFVHGLLNRKVEPECFMESVACGSATAYSEGFANKAMVEMLLSQMAR